MFINIYPLIEAFYENTSLILSNNFIVMTTDNKYRYQNKTQLTYPEQNAFATFAEQSNLANKVYTADEESIAIACFELRTSDDGLLKPMYVLHGVISLGWDGLPEALSNHDVECMVAGREDIICGWDYYDSKELCY